MDRGVGFRASDRCPAGSADPSRSRPGDERGMLPLQRKQTEPSQRDRQPSINPPVTRFRKSPTSGRRAFRYGLNMPAERHPRPPLQPPMPDPYISTPPTLRVVYFCSALENLPHAFSPSCASETPALLRALNNGKRCC